MNKTEHHKKAILEALEQSLGVVTSACKKIGIGRTTFYGWLKEDPEFKKQVDDISNIALDFAESQLHQQIKKEHQRNNILFKNQRQKAGLC